MKNLLVLLWMAASLPCFAQQSETDSLKRVLNGTLPDTTRASVYKKLANMFMASAPNTSLEYSRQGILFSREKMLPLYEGRCLRVKGDALESMGNYAEALKCYLGAMKIFEELDDKEDLGITYACVGVVYQDQEDYRQALNYTFKAKTINNSVQDTSELTALLLNIGYCYYLLNEPDSALYYETQACTLARHYDQEYYLGNILQNMALIDLRLGDSTQALNNFYESIIHSTAITDLVGLSDTYIELARVYTSRHNRDSSVYYATLSYRTAGEASYTRGLVDAGLLLSSLFDSTDKALAYDYFKAAMEAREDLFSAEKIRQVSNLQYDEEERQRELSLKEAEEKREQQENIQLAGIAIFIPAFLVLMLVLSRRRIKAKTLDFLGVVSTLMIFEFITLVLHPRIVVWTHHQPILELLVLMGVAAILAPAHHRFTHFIKTRLAKMAENRNRINRDKALAAREKGIQVPLLMDKSSPGKN